MQGALQKYRQVHSSVSIYETYYSYTVSPYILKFACSICVFECKPLRVQSTAGPISSLHLKAKHQPSFASLSQSLQFTIISAIVSSFFANKQTCRIPILQ